MDRFRWCSDEIETYASSKNFADSIEESLVLQKAGVRLYDGLNRSSFDNGLLKLTTHRLIWTDSRSADSSFIALPLAAVISSKIDDGRGRAIGRTPKITLKLLPLNILQNLLISLTGAPRWIDQWSVNNFTSMVVSVSNEDFVRLGFTQAGHHEFEQALNEVLSVKLWTTSVHSNAKSTSRSFGAGIGAIERQQAARAAVTDVSISEAFEDLNRLMSRAGDMVQLSRNLARKLRDAKDSDTLSINEIAELRSTMLSMGVMDELMPKSPNQSSSSNIAFYTQLAHQISNLIYPLLGGPTRTDQVVPIGNSIIDLASVYCRINRARGMNLISPNDLIRACQQLEALNLPLRLKSYPGGLLVLQLASEDEMETLKATSDLVAQRSSLTADELARAVNLSPLLAKARLLAIEEVGMACRDDSEVGLRFYPNYFTNHGAST